MTVKLIFDKNNPYWTNNNDANCCFVWATERQLTRMALHRGYIYLNEVYESLGFSWDPTDENKCWFWTDNALHCFLKLNFDVFRMSENRLIIMIED